MNEVLQALELFDNNRRSFELALRKAGGAAEVLLNQNAWSEIMYTLAANNIRITAEYLGVDEPT